MADNGQQRPLMGIRALVKGGYQGITVPTDIVRGTERLATWVPFGYSEGLPAAGSGAGIQAIDTGQSMATVGGFQPGDAPGLIGGMLDPGPIRPVATGGNQATATTSGPVAKGQVSMDDVVDRGIGVPRPAPKSGRRK